MDSYNPLTLFDKFQNLVNEGYFSHVAELSGNFAVIIGSLLPDYHGEIVRSSDWLARTEAER